MSVPTVNGKKAMIEFVDTHTHLFVEEFDGDRAAAVQRAAAEGVSALCLPCIDASSLPAINEMCNNYPGLCHAMIGLHPTELGYDYRKTLDELYAHLKNGSKFIAIGEVGLDFYWDDTRKTEQTDAFEHQIAWAAEFGLPLAIHSRNAFNELCAVMDSKRSMGLSGVFHCFSGSADEAHRLLGYEGFFLGIGGVLTYKNSGLPKALENVPLERIVLETDSPYLAPVPKRGKRNESSYLPFVAQRLAEIYNCPLEHVAEVTTANAHALFPKICNK